MLGKGHLLLGSAGFLAAGVPAAQLVGVDLSISELATGTVVAAGASMLPDLDHPQATVSRSLGPITEAISKVLAKLAGGHRNGTHSLLFVVLAALGSWALLQYLPDPLGSLLICFFFSSLVMRTLTEADGAACAILSAIVAATLVTLAPGLGWVWFAVACGCLLHMCGDILTPQGVPPLYPFSKERVRFPIIGSTGDWREKMIGGAAALISCYLLAVNVFIPLNSSTESPVQAAAQEQTSQEQTPESNNKRHTGKQHNNKHSDKRNSTRYVKS